MEKLKQCKKCGKLFMGNTGKVYCNKMCTKRHQPKEKLLIHKICGYCGKEYYPYNTTNRFCSSNCRINYHKKDRKFNWTEEQIERRKGENNPAYRNGNYVRGNKNTNNGMRLFGKNAKEIRESMINDCGCIYCQHCGVSN